MSDATESMQISACDCVAFRHLHRRHPEKITFAAQWLAYTLPCRRFADILADVGARLGVNVDRYCSIATGFHLPVSRRTSG